MSMANHYRHPTDSVPGAYIPQFRHMELFVDVAVTTRDYWVKHSRRPSIAAKIFLFLSRLWKNFAHDKYAHESFDTLIIGGDPLVAVISAITQAQSGARVLIAPSFPLDAPETFVEMSAARFAMEAGPAAAYLRIRFSIDSTNGSVLTQLAAIAASLELPDGSPAILLLPCGQHVTMSNFQHDFLHGRRIVWLEGEYDSAQSFWSMWDPLVAQITSIDCSGNNTCHSNEADLLGLSAPYLLVSTGSVIQTSVLSSDATDFPSAQRMMIGESRRRTAAVEMFTPGHRLLDAMEACSRDTAEVAAFSNEIKQMQKGAS